MTGGQLGPPVIAPEEDRAAPWPNRKFLALHGPICAGNRPTNPEPPPLPVPRRGADPDIASSYVEAGPPRWYPHQVSVERGWRRSKCVAPWEVIGASATSLG